MPERQSESNHVDECTNVRARLSSAVPVDALIVILDEFREVWMAKILGKKARKTTIQKPPETVCARQ